MRLIGRKGEGKEFKVIGVWWKWTGELVMGGPTRFTDEMRGLLMAGLGRHARDLDDVRVCRARVTIRVGGVAEADMHSLIDWLHADRWELEEVVSFRRLMH